MEITKGSTGNKSFTATWKISHVHSGSPGLSYANGYYTKAQANGTYCPSHYYEKGYYNCLRCGQNCGDSPTCTNNVCSHDKPVVWTIYESGYWSHDYGCTTRYVYVLGCGY